MDAVPAPRLTLRCRPTAFAAACNAVKANGLNGIYFWWNYVGQPLDTAPTSETANSFVDAPGAAAVPDLLLQAGG